MTSVLSGWRFDALIDTWWPAKADREEPLLLLADQISGPLRSILSRQANVEVLMDEVSGVDTDKRLVRLKQHKSEFTFIRALYNRIWFKFSSHLFLNWQQQDSGFAN
jgi:hypothetical protein